MAKRSLVIAAALTVVLTSGIAGISPASGSSNPSQGVTATTIRVGIPYVDVGSATLRTLGVDMDWGSVPDAFNALFHDLNAHGGINGRKIVPYFVAVSPLGTAPAATACTRLTEDDGVFAVIAPLDATCYLQHNIPVVASIYPAGHSSTLAQDFTTTPPASAYDPLQLKVFASQGIFKHKKVAIFGGGVADKSELASVKADLAKLHVNVLTTAVDSAPQGDAAASNAQFAPIAQHFQAEGVNEVVAVGTGAAVWPEGLSAMQSSYNPPWVATNANDFNGAVGSGDSPIYLSKVVTSNSLTPPVAAWENSGTQHCVHVIKKAYPSDGIRAYSPTLPTSKATWTSVEIACPAVALFADIAKAAGKNLTVANFVRAGYRLKNLSLPGSIAPISFGPNRPYELGPVYMVHYSPASKGVVYADKSAAG
jgi:hypothetical protein